MKLFINIRGLLIEPGNEQLYNKFKYKINGSLSGWNFRPQVQSLPQSRAQLLALPLDRRNYSRIRAKKKAALEKKHMLIRTI